MKIVRSFLVDDDLREALDHAPPGIIDARSWAYWNSKRGRYLPRLCRNGSWVKGEYLDVDDRLCPRFNR